MTHHWITTIPLLLALFYSCSRPQLEPQKSSVPLFEDLGSYHRSITTSNALAQKYFDQGLRLVYGFNHDEAERAFREAAELDANCAMAWWGVAVALGPNINLPLDPERNRRAVDAIQKAQSLVQHATEEERAYIAAISTRYSADPAADRTKLDHDYSNAMKELYLRYPDDDDAAVLYAESLMDLKPWQLWTADGKPQEGTEEILKTLEAVLARNTAHPGANHYYIHAIEASPNPEKGNASAERLRTLVPGAGHLVHMPAHIFIRTGNYKGAMEANEHAARIDEAYFAKTKVEGVYPMMYYTHNLSFLSTAAAMAGKSRQALDAAAKTVSFATPMVAHEPSAEYFLPWSSYAMARCGKWDDILASPRPADTTPTTLAFWHYAQGLAHIVKSDVNEARKDRSQFEEARSKVSADLKMSNNMARDLLGIAAAVSDARISAAAGDRETAIAQWKKAVDLQDHLIYDEPPAFYYPVRESLGGEYLRARRYPEAEQVFRRDLNINPHNGRSLFGLREALRGQSKNTEDVDREFQESWKEADVALSVEGL